MPTTRVTLYARQIWSKNPIPPMSVICGFHECRFLFWTFPAGWQVGDGGRLHPDLPTRSSRSRT